MSRAAKALLLMFALAGTLFVSACGGGGSNAVQSVDATTFLQVASQPGTTVIDVRTPEEYAAGHLDGAININVEGPDFATRISALSKTALYEVYCHSGRRSSLAADQMAGAGFTNINNLKGGIADLQAAGGRIVA